MQSATKLKEYELPYDMDLHYDIKTWSHMRERSTNRTAEFIETLVSNKIPIPQWMYDVAYPTPPKDLVIAE